MQKTAENNTEYSKKETISKIDHFAKSLAHAKMGSLGWNFFFQKRARNDSTRTVELFCAKNRWKKHRTFEKWDHFESQPFKSL